jgi:excisionase family DNA binding protein
LICLCPGKTSIRFRGAGIDGLTSSASEGDDESTRSIDAAAEPESMTLPEFMTLKEATQYHHHHYTTVYRLVHAGELPDISPKARIWRVKRVDLEDGSGYRAID